MSFPSPVGTFWGGFKDSIYSFLRDTEAEAQAEGEAGSLRGARRGTRSRVPEMPPGAEGRRSTAGPPRPGIPVFCPQHRNFPRIHSWPKTGCGFPEMRRGRR